MIQVRKNIFETNSSSTHTLTFTVRDPDTSEILRMIDKRTNTLVIQAVSQSEFIKNHGIISGVVNKLSYMITWIFIKYFEEILYKVPKSDIEVNRDRIGKMPELNILLDIFYNYYRLEISSVRLVVSDIVQWDHQTTADESPFVIDFNNRDAIIGYLFLDEISVQLGMDNGISIYN